MQDFRKLQVWTKAHQLTLQVYLETRPFPKTELFGLTSQMRRCSASIGANIAEGCGRGSDSDFGRFLQMALGSANELEYHLLLARDLDFIGKDAHKVLDSEVREIRKMLSSLIAKVKQPTAKND
jgi:four helix bundle protein